MKNLETERMILRKPRLEDAEENFEKWGSNEQLAEYSEFQVHKSIAESRLFLKSIIREAEEGVPFWFVEEKETNKMIAYIKSPVISYHNKTVNLSFYFLPSWRNNYFPEEALEKAMQYLFEEENLETIIIKFYDQSSESSEILDRIMKNIGMKKEGILRNRKINQQGEFKDLIVYSILKEEFEQKALLKN